jgi:hypothetical protein
MATTLTLTVVYQPVENGWTQARIEELPAVITAAPTAEQATDMLVDALRDYLLALGPSMPSPPAAETSSTGRLTVTIQAA